MIICTASFALMNAFVKILDSLPTFEIVFFRALGTVVITTPYLLLTSTPYFGIKRPMLFVRGVLGTISMVAFFMSMKYLSVGVAVSIRYLSPMFATMIAIVWMGERVRKIQWLFYLTALTGVFIIKQFDLMFSSIGLLLGLISAIFSGLVYVIVRSIGAREHPFVVVNYFMIVAMLVSGILMIPSWVKPSTGQWLFLLGLGVPGFIGQLYMTKALQSSSTSHIVPFKYTEVIFVLLISTLWLGETYSLLSLLGMMMVIIGMTANYLVSRKLNKSIDSVV